jgi:hypothetical protein
LAGRGKRGVLWVWDALARGWRLLTRPFATAMPYADIAVFVYALLAAALAFAHAGDLPSAHAWSRDHFLIYAQFGVLILLGVTQLAVLITERRSRRNKELEDACQLVAAYVDDHCPGVRLRDVGIHIWTTAGPPFARHLRRSGSFLLAGERERSGIVWVKGKGVVGAAWEESRRITRDIDAIRDKAGSRAADEELGPTDTMNLSWEEFRKTPRYNAISGSPLYRRTGDGSQIRGILAIDFLEGGHFEELTQATESSEFADVVGVCEASI